MPNPRDIATAEAYGIPSDKYYLEAEHLHVGSVYRTRDETRFMAIEPHKWNGVGYVIGAYIQDDEGRLVYDNDGPFREAMNDGIGR